MNRCVTDELCYRGSGSPNHIHSSEEQKKEEADDEENNNLAHTLDYCRYVVWSQCSVKFKRVERSDRRRRRRHRHRHRRSRSRWRIVAPTRFLLFTKPSRNLEIQRDPVIYASSRVTFRSKSSFARLNFNALRYTRMCFCA